MSGGALCDSAKAALAGDVEAPVLIGQTCDRVRSGDGVDQHFCAQEFGFREDAARQTYDAHVAELRACLGDVEVPVGPAVNHPDSYDQTVFEVEGRQVSVALKDKGALQKTYVFVRLPAN